MSVSKKTGIHGRLFKRWQRINKQIRQFGCPVDLPKIRPFQDGAYEILYLIGSYQMSNPYFWIFTFRCKKPITGEECDYSMEFSKQVVFLPVINGQVLLRHYFLPTLGYWNYWVPSILFSLLESKKEMPENEFPKRLIANELKGAQELKFTPDIDRSISVIKIGSSAKDRGMSVVMHEYYLVDIKDTEFNYLGGNKKVEHWKLFTLEDLDELAINNEKPWDNKSHTMINLLNISLRKGEIKTCGLSRK